MLSIPGADLENVFTLRTPDDANRIAENIAGKNVVIVGSSFIGEYTLFSPLGLDFVKVAAFTVKFLKIRTPKILL